MGRLSTSSGGGRLKTSSNYDLNSVEGLARYAQRVGLGQQAQAIVNPPQRLSILQRLGKGLGVLNPAEALLTGTEKGPVQGIIKYLKGIGQGLASAVTGTDYEGQRRTFSDVAAKFGVENGIAKFGIGLAGDILLDPSTYFGGAIARGVGKVAGIGSELALQGVGKLAPETETGLRLAGTGLKDAFGKAFVSGYKASEGALADTLSFLTKREKARLGIAASNLNRLGTGVLTEDQATELALKLVAGKRAEFVAREAGKGTEEAANLARQAAETSDPAVKKAIEAQIERTKKFAGQSEVQNPYETYFPFLKKDKVENFVKEISGKNIAVGSQNYLKQFKNLLTNENIELNPAKAFFTSESQQVTDRISRDFLEGFTKKYGKPLDAFTSSEEAGKAGFKVLREKGLFGKEIGYVSKYDSNLLTNLINPEFQTVNMLAKATGFDALTNLFKRSVTGLFLPFHVRNYASGIIQNFEAIGIDALNPKTIASGQKFAYLLAKGEEPADKATQKIFKAFADRFGNDTFYHNDFVSAVENGGKNLKQAEKVFSKSSFRSALGFQKGNVVPLLGNDAVPFKAARVVGGFIEHQQKATAYLAALGQGKKIPEALALAERAGFDYRNLTAFESQILKRIIPFYSFTRKNIELQLKTLGENPQRINQILAFFGNIGDKPSQEERQSLPSYIAGGLAVKLKDAPNGLKRYISSFGTPIEQFADILNGNPVLKQISTMNPLLKVPIELGIGKDSFRQKDLKDVYDASEYKGAPQIVKDLLGIQEVQKDVLEKRGTKLHKVGERTVYVADPVKLLVARSLFTSRGVTYLDQVFGNDLQGLVKVLKTTTGIKPQQIDLQLQDSFKEKEKKDALTELLRRMGEVATFSRAFVPK